jgi:two-component system, sensor histidine kinase YesM
METMREIGRKAIRRWRNLRIAWKFTLVYLGILALPIIVTGIFINVSATRSAIRQAGLLARQSMIQKKEAISQVARNAERTSGSVAYNPQVLKYIEDPFENNLRGYENYINSFAPFFNSTLIQNRDIYDTFLFIENKTFPDSWNNIFYVDSIENDAAYSGLLLDDSRASAWRPLHYSRTTKTTGDMGREKVFSHCQKLVSFGDKSFLGMLEIEIPERTLFESLLAGSSSVEYYLVLDEAGRIASEACLATLPARYMDVVRSKAPGMTADGVVKIGGESMQVSSVLLDEIACRLVGIAPLRSYLGSGRDGALIAFIVCVTLVLFGAIIHFVADRLTQRLKLLVEGLRTVQDGNINIKLSTGSRDEFGELAESFNHMTDRIHGLIEEVYKARITEKESELKALEAQINPHFLYNALSTLSWMARKVNAENIDNLAMQIAKFYRLVLSRGNSIIPVEDEIGLVKAYIEIEKTRFEDMFEVEYRLDPSAFGCRMIKLVLQPIVENAINHGLAPKGERGVLIIGLSREEDFIVFSIIDDGVGFDEGVLAMVNNEEMPREGKGGYAIYNVRERLRAVYGDRGRLHIESAPGLGCSVRIEIPAGVDRG